LEGAGMHLVVGLELDLHRSEEDVPLVARVLARRVGKLAHQRVVDVDEPIAILLAQQDREVVGDHGSAPDVDRPVVVEFAYEPATELHWPQATAEGASERALDHAFQPTFEAFQAHQCFTGSASGAVEFAQCAPPGTDRRTSARSRADIVGPRAIVTLSSLGEWRNWQTRRIQVPVSARTWGFKSPLAHHSVGPSPQT